MKYTFIYIKNPKKLGKTLTEDSAQPMGAGNKVKPLNELQRHMLLIQICFV